MRYYKDQNNNVYAFESAEEMHRVCSSKGWQDLTSITTAEKDEFTKPPEPTQDELATQARAERDRLMREVYDPAVMQRLRKRRVLSSASADVAGIDARLAEWDAYADALEVVPDQPGFPNSIEWPEAPSDSVVSGAEDGGVSCESESEPATSEV
ncbi:phage tail assembly chaperone [Desulfobaculum sp.]